MTYVVTPRHLKWTIFVGADPVTFCILPIMHCILMVVLICSMMIKFWMLKTCWRKNQEEMWFWDFLSCDFLKDYLQEILEKPWVYFCVFRFRPRHVMNTLEAIISESKNIPAYLPNISALMEALRKAKEWTARVETLQVGTSLPRWWRILSAKD